jgi:hypothetical protein
MRTIIIYAIIPFNLLKSSVVSIVAILLYNKVLPVTAPVNEISWQKNRLQYEREGAPRIFFLAVPSFFCSCSNKPHHRN